MNQRILSKRLKGLIFAVGSCALIIYTLIMPLITHQLFPEDRAAKWLWLSFIWLTAFPFYPALAYAWQIATRIGYDQSFTIENAVGLQKISTLTLADTLLLFTGNLVLCLLGINRIVLLAFSLLFCFFGFLLTVAAAVLSHLVQKAAALQEQNDLTI